MNRIFRVITRLCGRCVAVAAWLATSTVAQADPMVEAPAARHINVETGALVGDGGPVLSLGAHQSRPGVGAGTGTQMYHGGLVWQPRTDLQFGLDFQVFDDPPTTAIRASDENITLLGAAASVKYRLARTGTADVAAQGSLEYLGLAPGALGVVPGAARSDHLAASLALPTSFRIADSLRLHLVPGATFLPDTVDGTAFFGTSAHLGAGLTWQPARRLQLHAAATALAGPGGNTIGTDGRVKRTPVWTAGLRYATTPRTALDIYATNALGTTPATDLITLFPDADTPLFGIKLSYAQDRATPPAATYRRRVPTPATLQLDGLTTTSARTLPTQTARATVRAGGNGQFGALLQIAPAADIQIEGIVENYAADGSVGRDRNPTDDLRYMFGGRLQVLDQAYGDPISLSVRVLAGRNINRPTTGALAGEIAISRDLGARTTATINPRFAAFGDVVLQGLGLGITHRLDDRLALLAEITPLGNADKPVAALGARYAPRGSDTRLDLTLTNAIGHDGLGALVAQDTWRIGLGISAAVGRR